MHNEYVPAWSGMRIGPAGMRDGQCRVAAMLDRKSQGGNGSSNQNAR